LTETIPAEEIPAELARIARAGRLTDRCLWVVAAGAMLIAAWSVTLFAVAHGIPKPVAWLLDPLTATALLVALQADAVLGRHAGQQATGWGLLLRIGAGLATWTMNVWQAVADRDPAGIVAHSVPPALLVLLAEAAPHYRRKFAHTTAALQALLQHLADRDRQAAAAAARADREHAERAARAQRERQAADAAAEAERERAGRAERLAGLEAERARAHAEQAAAAAAVRQAEIEAGKAVELARAEAAGRQAEADRERLVAEQQRREERERRRESGRDQRAVRTGNGTGNAAVNGSGNRAGNGSGNGSRLLASVGTIEQRMRVHWVAERAAGRTPSGAELDRVGGTRDYGRKLVKKLLEEEAAQLRATAGVGQ
jgi:multidrug efflux pump subunit AcrA (membrane-fusion protein)